MKKKINVNSHSLIHCAMWQVKVHQHGSSFVRNKTFPYIRIMDSIPLVFQVYLKFYVCLQSVSCEVCEAFFFN